MAVWKKSSSEPLTTERQIGVYSDDGREGYVALSWEGGPTHTPRFYGPVFDEQRFYDASGAEIAEPKTTILDAAPTFA